MLGPLGLKSVRDNKIIAFNAGLKASTTLNLILQNAACPSRCLQRRAIAAQHGAANDWNRLSTLLHELVVKLLQTVTWAHLLFVIGAQLENLQLAQRIDRKSTRLNSR